MDDCTGVAIGWIATHISPSSAVSKDERERERGWLLCSDLHIYTMIRYDSMTPFRAHSHRIFYILKSKQGHVMPWKHEDSENYTSCMWYHWFYLADSLSHNEP